jgi:hypothetical protein
VKDGLHEIRTIRVIGGFVFVLGLIFLTLSRIFAFMHEYAGTVLSMALARYSNFTGKIAAKNFAEDKKLLAALNEIQMELIPVLESSVTWLYGFAILFLVSALLIQFFPRAAVQGFIALKILKRTPELSKEDVAD